MLAGIAVAVMLVLIVARLLIVRRARQRRAERRRLVPILISSARADEAALLGVHRDVIAEVTLELIDMVRGEERAAFLSKADALGVPKQLMRRLKWGSRRTRVLAAQGLSQFDQPEARRALYRALEDRSREVRLAAALALGASSQPPEAGELIKKLGLGTAEASLTAVSLFRQIAETRPDEIRALVLDDACSTSLRLVALEALATSGDFSLVTVITELALAAEDSSEALPRYLHALGKLGHPAARPAVLRGLGSHSMPARAAAAGAAGRILLKESADRLTELLDDPEWWVRFRSAESLILLGEPGIARLQEVTRSGAERARAAASTVLAERGLAG
ncbi:HEAT repeat domain-containing protein [Sphingomonas jeddahensis]|uniref:HEAT repeat domain-containing protein n=1 Tax=Sphingomonas jeddahensis TaxID=1915074 RepID=UPI001300FE6E|nr:HEAT repeat domain-containing protein [Sphingomonas jeddahensis]